MQIIFKQIQTGHHNRKLIQ